MSFIQWKQISSNLSGSGNLTGSLRLTGSFFLNNTDILNQVGSSGIFKPTGSVYSTTNDLQITGSLIINGVSMLSAGGISQYSITEDARPTGIDFNNTGTKMYIAGGIADKVFQYTLTSPYNIASATYDGVSLDASGLPQNPSNGYNFTSGIAFGSAGSKLFLTDEGSIAVFQYNLSTPYDLSTAVYSGASLDVSGQDIYPNSVRLSTDGSKLYVLGLDSAAIYEYDLSTNFDLSTATYNSNFTDLNTLLGLFPISTYGMAFSSDGTVLIVSDNQRDRIYEFSLSSGFDITTATATGNSVSTVVLNPNAVTPQEVVFNNDGTKFFIVDDAGDFVLGIDLETAYDITSYNLETGLVDYELNTSTATTGSLLSYNGEDYVWIDKITQGIFKQTGSAYASTNDIQITGSLETSGSVGINGVIQLTPLEQTPAIVAGGIFYSSSNEFYFGL